MTKYLPIALSVQSCKIIACNRLWRTITKLLAGVSLVALLWAPAPAALAQQEEVIESGQQQFSQQCLGPHLKEQPADLSRLSERNGGTFPFWEVYGKIDGRDKVGAHGPDDMPVWGTDERYEGTSGRLAMGQILELVFFLQSIQEE